MKGIAPKSKWQRLRGSDLPFDLLIAISALATGILNARKEWASDEPNFNFADGVLAVAVFAFFVVVAKAIKKFSHDQREDEVHALVGVLHSLHAILINGRLENARAGIRLCVFYMYPNGTAHQITDYIGDDGKSGRKGRTLAPRTGVVGKAFLSEDSQFNSLPRNLRIEDYLASEFAFDRSEIADMRLDRKSWAAIPVGSPVVAIIYIDSTDGKCFGNKNSPSRKALQSAALGVARFISHS